MTELKYALLKDNRVKNVIVMHQQDDTSIAKHCEVNGFDSFVFVGVENVAIWSTYDGETFTPPTLDYLYEIGILSENPAMRDVRLLAEEQSL